MKKTLLIVAFLAGGFFSNAQTLISNSFDGYDGLVPTIAPGWYYSFNDSTAATRSFYTSVATCGITPPAYKFGHDTIVMITPAFSNADSVRYWMKGNAGTNQPHNHFEVLESPDSINWTTVTDYDSISASGLIYSFAISNASTHLKFTYHKDSLGYNVGIDDIAIFKGTFNGIAEVKQTTFSMYPNPTKGTVSMHFGDLNLHDATISVLNILGKEVKTIRESELNGNYSLDLSAFDDGMYVVRVKSDKTELIQRVILRK